jgi:hypothetical protein
MRIGTKVVALHMPELGVGIIVDITPAGLLRVLFDTDDYCDDFDAQELELAPADTEAQAA